MSEQLPMRTAQLRGLRDAMRGESVNPYDVHSQFDDFVDWEDGYSDFLQQRIKETA